MKRRWKKICAAALAGMMCTGLAFSSSALQDTVTAAAEDEAAGSATGVDQIPGTDRTMVEEGLNGSFLSVSGFAKGNVNAEDEEGNTRSDYTEEDTDYYAVVTNEMEFFEALNGARYDSIKVIELRADLNLGWEELDEEVQEEYGPDGEGMIEPYLKSQVLEQAPVGQPSLIESGVSTLTLSEIDGLTIFSTMGNTIRHAEIKLNAGVNDVIMRNLKFTGMWEWDDWRTSGYGQTGGTGNKKRSGWSNIKLNGCSNVWIDHCTLGNAFDGNIDIENGSYGITISWCKIGDDDVSVGSDIYKTVQYLEELYQQSKQENSTVSSFSIYKVMRDNGMTLEQIMKYMSQHDKCHLCGAGDQDSWLWDKANKKFLDAPNYDKPDANEKIRLSLAYNYYSDTAQRVPMVRSGMAHMYNCYINDWDESEVYAVLNSDPKQTGKTISQQISELRKGNVNGTVVTLARGMDARNGASVAADTCVYYGAQTAITGTAYHPLGGNISDGFEKTWGFNYALVVNSSFQKYNSDSVYEGSSWDNNGDNPFIQDKHYWDMEKHENSSECDRQAAKSIIGNWKWRQEGVNIKPDENYEDKLPYAYQTFPLKDVVKNTETYSGYRKIEMSASDWLKTEYEEDYAIRAVDPEKEIPLESISFRKPEVTLFMEEEFAQLEVTALPYNTTEKPSTYKYESSDPSIARVNDCGLVIPVSTGSVTITITTENGKTASCKVNVTNLPKAVEITNIPETIYTGDIFQLSADVLPGDLIDETVFWENAGARMELIDAEKGIFKALRSGSNAVQATAKLTGNRVGNRTGITKNANLTIVDPDVFTSGVEVEENVSLKAGELIQLNAKVLPDNATNKKLFWSISDRSIADIDQNGKVTAVKNGTATVTVTTVNGGYTAECQVAVGDGDIVEPSVSPAPSQRPSTAPETSASPAPAPSTKPEITPGNGDVDGNSKVDLTDAQMVLKYALKIAQPSTEQKAAADVDGNGTVDLADAQNVLKAALKIISLPLK